MRPLTTVFIFFLVITFVACNSRKTLNELTGKELLQQALSSAHEHRDGLFYTKDGDLWVSFSRLDYYWMGGQENMEDLSQATVPHGRPDTNEIKHLFDAQFITLTANTRPYSLARDWTGNTQTSSGVSFPLEMHLTVNETTADVTGRWSETQAGMAFPGTVGGWLMPNKLYLFWSTSQNDRGYYNAYHPKQFEVYLPISAGPLTQISHQLGDGTTLTLNGTNIQTLQLKICKYEWAPKIKPFFNSGTGSYRIGKINISEISGLLLSSETQAKAFFTWSLVPNELGLALVGTQLGIPSARRGSVEYNKKPDGTWVLTHFSLM